MAGFGNQPIQKKILGVRLSTNLPLPDFLKGGLCTGYDSFYVNCVCKMMMGMV